MSKKYMQCPKCKKTTDDNAQYCSNCGAKVNVLCPACHALNPLGSRICHNCRYELLKYCPKCHAANNPKSKNCRKCGADLNTEHPKIVTTTHPVLKTNKQKLSQNSLNKPTVSVTTHVISPKEPQIKVEEQAIVIEENVKQIIKDEHIENVILQEPSMEKICVPQEKIDTTNLVNEETKEQFQETSSRGEENLLSVLPAEATKPETKEKLEKIAGLDQLFENNDDKYEYEPPNENVSVSPSMLENITNLLDETELEENEQEEQVIDVESNNLDNDDIIDENELFLEEDFDIYFQSQQNAQNTLSDLIANSKKYIFGLSGDDGVGKTYVLREVFNQLQSPDLLWLWAECTPLTQVTTMGAIQDALVNFFNISLLCADIEEFKNDTKKFFSQEFPELNNNEIDLLINFLYPHKTSFYENIKNNRERTFAMLEKLFTLIHSRGKIVFIIDDFELIDGSSYDFICRLIQNGIINENMKLVATYKDTREVEGFIESNILSPQSFESVHLGSMSDDELETMIYSFLMIKDVVPKKITDKIKQNAQGSPAYVEATISYLSEIKAIEFDESTVNFNPKFEDIEIPQTLSEIVQAKIERFAKEDPSTHKVLMNAALLGNRFNLDVLNYACELEAEIFEESIKLLICWGYFMQLNSSTFSFKNNLLWRECYEYVKNDPNYLTYNSRLHEVVADSILTNNSLKALLVQNMNLHKETFDYWTQNAKLASYIGDISLYVISQKQSLKYLDFYHPEHETLIKNNIYERIGKLLSDTAPLQAMEFLSNAIIIAEGEGNVAKIVDIASYLGVAAQLTDNYLGVIEIVDLVLKYIKKEENPLGWVLIQQKKLISILKMGNSAELIDIAENDILPILKNYVYSPKNGFSIEPELIYKGWIEANLALAQTYILQGSNRATAILCSLNDLIDAHKIENSAYRIQIDTTRALNYTLNGHIKKSIELLRNISQQHYGTDFDPVLRSKWNLVNALNKFFLKQYDKLKPDLFDVVTFANNCGDAFTKNLLKLILGKIIYEEGDYSKATNIYNEQVSIFAETKVAIGAMAGWYFVTEATLQTEGSSKALEIAQKALEVAKNPKIKNYLFMILYKMQIAKIYEQKGDLEAAKMYLEKALLVAKKGDMYSLKVKLHILYGQCFEKIISIQPTKKKDLEPRIRKNYQTAIAIAKKIESSQLVQEAQNAVAAFENNK